MDGFGKSFADLVAVGKPRPTHRLAGLVARRRVAPVNGVRQQLASLYLTAAVLATIGFLYGSAIPLVFAAPNYLARIRGAFEPSPWNLAQLFDVVANVLAFVPLGFLWGAACNTLLPNSRARSGLFVTVATGCLCLAVLAETLQIWIPLRDPSIRDVLALEWGAVLGYGFWLRAGRSITLVLSRWIESIAGPDARPLLRFRWPALFFTLFAAALVLNVYASPSQLFLLYRFRSTSLEDVAFALQNANVKESHDLQTVWLPSAATALVLVAACFAAQRGVRLAFARRGRSR
jgi:VanZ family protein